MSPHELSKIEDRLFPALERLGWERYETEVPHEREWDSSRIERGWKRGGVFIISDDEMTDGLALELIRLAG